MPRDEIKIESLDQSGPANAGIKQADREQLAKETLDYWVKVIEHFEDYDIKTVREAVFRVGASTLDLAGKLGEAYAKASAFLALKTVCEGHRPPEPSEVERIMREAGSGHTPE
jgi:hypothetical protein